MASRTGDLIGLLARTSVLVQIPFPLGWASQTMVAVGPLSSWLAFFSLFCIYVQKESKRLYG